MSLASGATRTKALSLYRDLLRQARRWPGPEHERKYIKQVGLSMPYRILRQSRRQPWMSFERTATWPLLRLIGRCSRRSFARKWPCTTATRILGCSMFQAPALAHLLTSAAMSRLGLAKGISLKAGARRQSTLQSSPWMTRKGGPPEEPAVSIVV